MAGEDRSITEANPGPRLVLGEIALRQGRSADALLHFERALVIANNVLHVTR